MNITELYERLKTKYSHMDYETFNGSEYICQLEEDDFLHTFFYGLDEGDVASLSKELSKMNKKGVLQNDFGDSLKEFNGSILYSGSVVLFGLVKKKDLDEDCPSSIIDANLRDPVSQNEPHLLYFGNAPCSLSGNLNFYYDMTTHKVIGIHKGNRLKEWSSLSIFYSFLYETIDSCYADDGYNINYGSKEHFVYNNIQKIVLLEDEKL